MEKANEQDSKPGEVQTPSDQSPEKNEPGTVDDTTQKTYTEEEIATLKKKATDFDALIAKQAEEKREKRLAELNKPEPKPQHDSELGDDYEAEQRRIVRDELSKAEAQKTEQNFNNALDKFIRQHPKYSPENDILDVNWKKIKKHVEELRNGVYKGSEDGYLERLNLIHNGITKEVKPEKPESETEKVDDSGVGNIASQSKAKQELPSALTRPLNKFEKMSAEAFPGNTPQEREANYRKRLAEIEALKK